MKKILIVDDEEIILEYLAYELNFSGFYVQKAISGNEAISILKNETFDLILSDVRMKDGNGFELLDYVKKNNLKLNFYFMSADLSLTDAEFQQYQIAGHFRKPFDFDELIRVLK